MKAWQHLKTILNHKKMVRTGCFKVGLYRQGIMHDWSKYSPVEFFVGCKYYQGTKSPNNAERVDKGYSSAWLHHKGRNKHHLEYWIDYDVESGQMAGMRMPKKYVVEMFIDRVAASKNYQKEKYTDRSPLEYYEGHGDGHYMIHRQSQKLLEKLLHMLAKEGEESVYRYIRRNILKNEYTSMRRKMRNNKETPSGYTSMRRKMRNNKETPSGYTFMCRKMHNNKETPSGYTSMCRKMHNNKESRMKNVR